MNQELPVPNWDNFTPGQKHLFQVWIKSLEDAEAASMELIKSFSDKEITPEATSASNRTAFAENADFTRVGSPTLPRDIPCWAMLSICQAKCVLNPNPQQCSNDCKKQYICT